MRTVAGAVGARMISRVFMSAPLARLTRERRPQFYAGGAGSAYCRPTRNAVLPSRLEERATSECRSSIWSPIIGRARRGSIGAYCYGEIAGCHRG